MTIAGRASVDEAPRSGSWLLLLLPPVLAYTSPVVAEVALDLRYLLVPVAALLGARFGLTGVIAVAIGGLAFVVNIVGSGWGAIGGHPSLYLIALAVAAIAAFQKGRLVWPEWPQTARSTAAVMMTAPMLLVLVLLAGHKQQPADGVRVAFVFVPQALAYFLIFMLAVRGAKLWQLLAGLAVVGFVSWSLTYVALFPSERSNLQVDLRTLQPLTALTALVFFSAGARLNPAYDRPVASGWWRWPYWTAAVLLFISVGALQPIALAVVQLSKELIVTLPWSSPLLLVTAFMLGVLRGTRGAWIAAAIATALLVAGYLGNALSREHFYTWSRHLETPFLAYAYGALGGYLSRFATAESAARKRSSNRTLTAWLLATGTMLGILGEGGAVRVTLAVVFAVLFGAGYFLGRRIVRATAGTDREITPEGWLSFLTVVCLAVLVALNLREVAQEAMKQALGIWGVFTFLYDLAREAVQSGQPLLGRSGGGLVLLYFAVVALAIFAVVTACRKALKDLRKVWRDLRILSTYGRLVLSSRNGTPPSRR